MTHAQLGHTAFTVGDWVLYVSRSDQPVTRLVVFVHGFNGKTVSTWNQFTARSSTAWWQQTDMLFVGYDSLDETITGVANRLRRELPKFYPNPYREAMRVFGMQPRQNADAYTELILAGHSLGGLIVRRALCDAALKWEENDFADQARPVILDASTRLFSPASAGFRAGGVLGLLRATGAWGAIEAFLRRSSAFSDLQPGSETLVATRSRTERLALREGLECLRGNVIWANPDNVVLAERYDTDFVDDSWDKCSHTSVCKPRARIFENPWYFVESGEPC